MKAGNRTYPFIYSFIMLLTLVWLSVGISFVYMDQQATINEMNCPAPDDASAPVEDTCPFDDSEETPETCNNSFPAEFLQENFETPYNAENFVKHAKSRYKGDFVFFHVECFSPPPDPLS